MAKRKRAPHEKPFSRPMPKASADATVAETLEDDAVEADSAANESPQNKNTDQESAGMDIAHNAATDPTTDNRSTEDQVAEDQVADNETGAASEASRSDVAQPFVGKWNRLISTTNWEKGQIICEWREALVDSGAAVTEYSDEAWAQTVGGVTSQHVGRLRRVYQRFGDVTAQYEGLHWSHFQACLDWDDAEMWLEGSIQNNWSVSQMRGKRWETVGGTPEEQQAEVEQVEAEQAAALELEAEVEEQQARAAAADHDQTFKADSVSPSDTEIDSGLPSNVVPTPSDSEVAEPVEKRTRLSVDVESLPDDLAEAFESFKLAIIAHRRENWRDTTPESVVECLDSLKQLALADSEQE